MVRDLAGNGISDDLTESAQKLTIDLMGQQ